ncbi:Neuroendocrine convertase 1, partial [Paramuricea clavata]
TGSKSFKRKREKIYTNGWAVKVKGGFKNAKIVAKRHGFAKVEKIGTLEDYYHFEHPTHPTRSRRSAVEMTDLLHTHPNVEWAEQQHEKLRVKRGAYHDAMVKRHTQVKFRDPLWSYQWYLDDSRKGYDMDVHVMSVWKQGITGKGVVVTILDDGVEHNHTDIMRNYDPAASWDVNGGDPDPFPRYDSTNENKHGTRCAGEVAGQANNHKCGVGVAYNARIGGVRMLDGRVTDKVEAESLSLNPQYIDIYSASWGPSDDGTTVEGPGTLATAAFLNGIKKGRDGKGSIFVWASGNGGRHDDSCNCDGYTNSIYTLSISSSSDHGESPWYSEACSSTLATTFSSGSRGEQKIATTDLHNQCTEKHTGTSASAPLAAGVIALALEANPNLTWRDIQHIVVWTSKWRALSHDSDWNVNGLGRHVNRKFGFGLLDAHAIVALAKLKKKVPEKTICHGQINQDRKLIRREKGLTVKIKANGCQGNQDELRYLEHVQLVLTLDYTRRGDLAIDLTSPMGTKSRLLSPRGEDLSDEGFMKWPFMTTHSWGEDPRGAWTLEINDEGDSRANHGMLREWGLVLHGTKDKPPYQRVKHPDKPRPTKAVPKRKTSHVTEKVPDGPTYTFGPPPNLETIKYKPLNEHAKVQTQPRPVQNVYREPLPVSRTNIPQQPAWTNNYPQNPPPQPQPIASYETVQSPAYNYPSRSFGTSDISAPYYGQMQPRLAYDQWNSNNAYGNYPPKTYNTYNYLRSRRKRRSLE